MDERYVDQYIPEENNNIFEDTVETIKQGANKITEDVSNAVNEGAKKTVDFYTSKLTVIAGLIFVILLSIFVSYGLYVVITTSIFNQSRIVIEGTNVPVLCNVYSKFSLTTFNKTGNGKRRSYTFWIYINDMNTYSGSYKHVFHIGDADNIRSACPYVFLDKDQNKMFVRFAAVKDDSLTTNYSSVQSLIDNPNEFNNFMKQGIEIPYIPLQRWVHIAIVINENANGGTIVAYVDGDISKIVSSNEINANGSIIKVNNLDLDKMGDLYVGGTYESSRGPGFSGLISKVALFNYDLNDKDIYDDYNKGPLNGFLSSLGLANYGLRSPIYKIV